MKNNMYQLAEHILSLDVVDKKHSVLSLQKIMYFTLIYYIEKNGITPYIEELYDEEFEAWDYGPINRTVYMAHRHQEKLTEGKYYERFSDLDQYILKLKNKNPYMLTELSQSHMFWRENKKNILNRTNKYYYKLKNLQID